MATIKKAQRKIHNDRFDDAGKEIVNPRQFAQRAQLDTSGLAGPSAHEIEAGYITPELRGGQYLEGRDPNSPVDAELLQHEREQRAREVLRGS